GVIDKSGPIDRRTFLQAVALGAASATVAAADPGQPSESILEPELQTVPHPLDPLTAREIETVSRLLNSTGKTDVNSLFSTITLAPQAPEEPPGRRALAVVYQTDKDETYEHIVDLTGRTAVQSRSVQGARPGCVDSEYRRAIEVTFASPEFARAMAKRGI